MGARRLTRSRGVGVKVRAGSKTVAGLYSRQLTIMPVYLSMSSVFLNVFLHILRLLDASTGAHRIPGYLSASFEAITGEGGGTEEGCSLCLTYEGKKFL